MLPAIIRRNPSTTITVFFAVVALLPPVVADARDQSEALGVSPRFWLVVSAILAAAAILGQGWQQITPLLERAKWGAPEIIALIAAVVSYLQAALDDLTTALDPIGIPPSFWVGVGLFLTLVAHFIRVLKTVRPNTEATAPKAT